MPWTHRALNYWGTMNKEFQSKNIFSHLPENYTTFAYTHNMLAEILLNQFNPHILNHPSIEEGGIYYERIAAFEKDMEASFWGEKIARGESFLPIKPMQYFGTLLDLVQQIGFNHKINQLSNQEKDTVQINHDGLSFDLSLTFNWLLDQMSQLSQPFLSYLHLYPPHGPYPLTGKFAGTFENSWAPPDKPNLHHFEETTFTSNELAKLRSIYSLCG